MQEFAIFAKPLRKKDGERREAGEQRMLAMFWDCRKNGYKDGNQKLYDIDDVVSTLGEPNVSFFAEYITDNGTSWRFDARDLTNNEQCRERIRYVGRLSAGILEEIENRCSIRGLVMSLKITGTF